MLSATLKQFKIAFIMLVLLSCLTGIIYPLVVTGLAQIIFPWQANGSLVSIYGSEIGSNLIGQFFNDPKYFWGRPSATRFYPYNALYSSGSNLGPSNPVLLTNVNKQITHYQQFTNSTNDLIPVDLVTTSASGLDPAISPLAAYYQVRRIAKIRNISESELTSLIDHSIRGRTLGILGEPRVNVLKLNLALDALAANLRR